MHDKSVGRAKAETNFDKQFCGELVFLRRRVSSSRRALQKHRDTDTSSFDDLEGHNWAHLVISYRH